jgi:hypothetical protein
MMLAVHAGELLSWGRRARKRRVSSRRGARGWIDCKVLCAVALVQEMIAMRWNDAEFKGRKREVVEGKAGQS